MKSLLVGLTGLLLVLASHAPARAETAIGAVFGYPGNAGLSLRFDTMPMGIAWSEDYIHGTIDKWAIKRPLGEEEKLDWYLGPGLDVGIPFDDSGKDFFLAVRAPIGLQFMFTPKIEGFGEAALGAQLVDEFDFYWSSSLGIRFILGK